MPRLTDFQVLTFDCYGTLVDWERGILSELRPWAASHGLQLEEDAILESFGEAEARWEAETPEARYPQILGRVLESLASQWSVATRSGEAAAFGQSVGRWPAFPDSAPSLQYLQRYYKLAILSNVDRASFARTERQLGVLFDLVVTAEDVGSYKPNPRNFEFVLAAVRREFGIEQHEVLHTAQSVFHDIVPAKKAGLATMWVNRRKGREGRGATVAPADGDDVRSDFEVASLAEFVALHRSEMSAAAPNRE